MNWRLLLGGMLLWALHFFALYGIGSIWLSSLTARVLTGVISLLCLGGEAWLASRVLRHRGDRLDQWMRNLSATFIGLASVAIIWQAMPALLG